MWHPKRLHWFDRNTVALVTATSFRLRQGCLAQTVETFPFHSQTKSFYESLQMDLVSEWVPLKQRKVRFRYKLQLVTIVTSYHPVALFLQ